MSPQRPTPPLLRAHHCRARDRLGLPAQPPRQPTAWLEVALVLLVIPFLGWVVGVVLLWMSRLWTTRDKLIGTLGGLSMAEATSTPPVRFRLRHPVGSPPRARLLGRERPW